ncbi:hypothetical protein [Streptomyces sp. NPDC058872]|uniref:effector-associated constant component EACC1 n=1 Tax=Streptomyces sp. NPDC058872 TaxID=3346661 RepID=UPI0036D1DE5B
MSDGILLTAPVDDARAADSLRRWLMRDGAVQRAELRSTGKEREGVLADPVAIIAIIVSGVLALPGAIDSVKRWRKTQPSTTSPVVLRIGSISVEITGNEDAATLSRYVELLQQAEGVTQESVNPDAS